MTKLFLRSIATVIFFLTLFLIGEHVYFAFIQDTVAESRHHILSRGVIANLQTQLAKQPQDKWGALLQKLQPTNGFPANTISIKNLKWPPDKIKQLMEHHAIIQQGPKTEFLGSILANSFVYKRIGNTHFALRLQDGGTMQDTLLRATSWQSHLIYLRLNSTPQKLWKKTIQKISTEYKLPLSLVHINDSRLHAEIKQQLKTNDVAYPTPTHKNPIISILYMKTPDPNLLVKLGPIYQTYYWMLQHDTTLYDITFYLFSILVVILLTYFFIRNINKIYLMTKHYSRANFNYLPPFSRFSMLYDTYKNVASMGKSLDTLITSHHYMARFVAHEARTPLTAMQFGLDRLSLNSKNLTTQDLRYISSLESDITDLNQLVTEFLLYSQNTTQDLKLNKENLCIRSWLTTLTEHHQITRPNITLNTPQETTTMLYDFDPNLLKHAINNLISNAHKFAAHQIAITLDTTPTAISIHIDDDGQGISEETKQYIFKPFTTFKNASNPYKHIGLGLNIAQTIVELHDGVISITQAPLGGARFTVQLPWTQPK